MGGNLLKNQKGVKNKSFFIRSCAEKIKINFADTFLVKTPRNKGFKTKL